MAMTNLQRALAKQRLNVAQRLLTADDDSADLTTEQARTPDWDTDVTNIDDNPVDLEETREPDERTDVQTLPDPDSETPSKTSSVEAARKAYLARKRKAAFGDDDQAPAAPAADPTASDPSADGAPEGDSDGDELADSLPIDWKQDPSGQPYGTIQGTDLDIFVKDDMSWQVLPEGSDQPVAQGTGTSFNDALQQAFDAGSQLGQQAGDSPAAAGDPTAPQAAPSDDPNKTARRKRADATGKRPEDSPEDARIDVTNLEDHPEDMDPGTFSADDFANNASDDLAKPKDGSDVFNSAPGGGSFKDNNKKASVRKTSGIKAVELAEVMQSMGIIDNTREAKFKAAAIFERTPAAQTKDRLALLGLAEKAFAQRAAAAPRKQSRAPRVPNLNPGNSRVASTVRGFSREEAEDIALSL